MLILLSSDSPQTQQSAEQCWVAVWEVGRLNKWGKVLDESLRLFWRARLVFSLKQSWGHRCWERMGTGKEFSASLAFLQEQMQHSVWPHHITKRTTEESAFPCGQERAGNWIELGQVDFEIPPPQQYFALSGSEFDAMGGQRSSQALLKICFSLPEKKRSSWRFKITVDEWNGGYSQK